MTTLLITTDSYVDHASAANFRLWGSTISAHLAALGLVQSADSGQINWTTVALPTVTNTAAGYEIWKFNDSLFATNPIYLKVQYGTDNALGRPATWITVATGTNGAGVLTGSISSQVLMTNGGNPVANNLYVSRGCFVNGFLTVDFYRDAYGNSGNIISLLRFCVSRTVDDSGTPSGDGYVLTTKPIGVAAQMQPVNVAKNTVGGASLLHTCVPGNFNSTLTDDTPGNYQAFKPYVLFPKMRPVYGLCSVFGAEAGRDVQFGAILIGTTSHNYIATGQQGYGNQQDSRNGNGINLATLWE